MNRSTFDVRGSTTHPLELQSNSRDLIPENLPEKCGAFPGLNPRNFQEIPEGRFSRGRMWGVSNRPWMEGIRPRYVTLIIFIIIAFFVSCGQNPVDPADLIYRIERTKVEVRGRELYVNDQKFIVKGVGYQPTPIGYNCGAWDFFNDSSIYTRDIPLLREMGCNTIRTWAKVTSKAFLDYCYNGGNSPIYVIMGFSYNPINVINSSFTQNNTITEFKNYVATYKDHPAVLMWCIGNDDNNVVPNNDSDRQKLHQFINEMARQAHLVEGGEFHPATCAVADLGVLADIGNPTRKADDASMIYLDVWGVNLYPTPWPNTFDPSFTSYKGKSSKPMLVTEYGFDAYWNGTGEDTTMQATNTVKLWKSIVANSEGVCVGASIMAYADEWWKAGNPAVHDTTGGGGRFDQPDNNSNEEWYGLMKVSSGGGGPDIVTPRPVYYQLQALWR